MEALPNLRQRTQAPLGAAHPGQEEGVSMNDLVDFVRAQLDEDERVARAADAGRWLPEDKGITFEYRADDFHEGEAQARLVADSRANQEHIACWWPARVRAEVDAKRRIVDQCAGLADMGFVGSEWPPGDMSELAAQVLSMLALPYADQPGYRDEWRPTD
jgi:hypothetical protein